MREATTLAFAFLASLRETSDSDIFDVKRLGGPMNSSGRGSRSYPDPLQRLGILNPANWILPATALSIISPLALLMVTVLLASTEELWAAWRLRLPFFAAGVPAIAALLLSWLVAWRCSRRPGRLWPRLWAFILALASTALAPLAFFYGSQSPLLAALSCATLAGAVFLLPRLLRLHPDSSWIGGWDWSCCSS